MNFIWKDQSTIQQIYFYYFNQTNSRNLKMECVKQWERVNGDAYASIIAREREKN